MQHAGVALRGRPDDLQADSVGCAVDEDRHSPAELVRVGRLGRDAGRAKAFDLGLEIGNADCQVVHAGGRVAAGCADTLDELDGDVAPLEERRTEPIGNRHRALDRQPERLLEERDDRVQIVDVDADVLEAAVRGQLMPS